MGIRGFVLGIAFVAGWTAVALGDVLYVDAGNPSCPGSGTPEDPYCRIQDAIVAAFDGDTVLVAPGTYLEQVDFLGKTIEVRSSGGEDVTRIDASRQGAVVTFQSGEGNGTLLEGFTLTGGTGVDCAPDHTCGGGVYCRNGSSPTVRSCRIEGNSADSGGGIFCSGASLTVERCSIRVNTSGFGGGLYVT